MLCLVSFLLSAFRPAPPPKLPCGKLCCDSCPCGQSGVCVCAAPRPKVPPPPPDKLAELEGRLAALEADKARRERDDRAMTYE